MRIKEGYDYADAFALMCQYFVRVVEGDDWVLDEAYDLMRKHGIVDENDELIEEDDD